MPLWPARPDPWPSTPEEALALSAHWHVNERFLQQLADNPDPERRVLLIQSYIAFLYNSFVPARWFYLFLPECICVVVLIALARRFVTPRIIHRLPRPLRNAHTAVTKSLWLTPLVGHKALAAVPLVPLSRWAPWTTVQVPLRPHALVLGVYVVANVLVVSTGYDIPWPNDFYSEEQGHLFPLIRHVADRTGVLALGSTPLVFLLAARNSPFTWITGANFGTLQLYHRGVARVTYANATLHVLGYSLIHLRRNQWAFLSLFDRKCLVLGWVAFSGGWVLCFGAWRRIRQIAYEAFLISRESSAAFYSRSQLTAAPLDILAALAWVVGAYLHIFFLDKKGGSDEYLRLCYLAIAAWGFDRGARRLLGLWRNTALGRTFFPGAPPLSASSRSTRRRLTADGVLLGGSSDIMRLRITPSSPWPHTLGGPGSYIYISCFSAGHRVWESHPFSIAWPLGVPGYCDADDNVDSGASTPVGSVLGSSAGKYTRLKDVAATADPVSAPVEAGELHPFDEDASPASFELLIKRHSGFTRSLSESLKPAASAIPSSGTEELVLSAVATVETSQAAQISGLRIAVEGPYGSSSSAHPCATYAQALLVAGGSGLAMVTSQLADLGLCALQGYGEVRCERVVVVWSVREAETVALIIPYLVRLYRLFSSSPSFRQRLLAPSSSSRPPFIDLHIYITSSNSLPPPSVAELSSLSPPAAFIDIELHSDVGRPDIAAHIDSFASQHQSPSEELLVVSCGPATLCDAAREAVRSRLGGSGSGGEREACRLIYSEEAVVW